VGKSYTIYRLVSGFKKYDANQKQNSKLLTQNASNLYLDNNSSATQSYQTKKNRRKTKQPNKTKPTTHQTKNKNPSKRARFYC